MSCRGHHWDKNSKTCHSLLTQGVEWPQKVEFSVKWWEKKSYYRTEVDFEKCMKSILSEASPWRKYN
jgi:hypothetical protein